MKMMREDDKPLVRPTTRKEPHEEVRDQAIDDEDLATFGSSETFETSSDSTVTKKKRDHQYGRIQLLFWNKGCQGTRGSEKRRPRFWAKCHKVKHSETLSKSCLWSVI